MRMWEGRVDWRCFERPSTDSSMDGFDSSMDGTSIELG